jgi:hypothetical protein
LLAAKSQNRSLPPLQTIQAFWPRLALSRTCSGASLASAAISMISLA